MDQDDTMKGRRRRTILQQMRRAIDKQYLDNVQKLMSHGLHHGMALALLQACDNSLSMAEMLILDDIAPSPQSQPSQSPASCVAEQG